MKTLASISLFAKYVGLKRESDAIETNSTIFRTLLDDGPFKERLEGLDEDLVFTHARLSHSLEEHKKLFLEHAGELLDAEGSPNDEFLKLFLVVTQIIGGHIHSCMNYVMDLLRVLKPTLNEEQLVDEVTKYTTNLAYEGFIRPGEGLLDGDPSKVTMVLSDKGNEFVKEELKELRARMLKESTKSPAFDLMTMIPPTTAIN